MILIELTFAGQRRGLIIFSQSCWRAISFGDIIGLQIRWLFGNPDSLHVFRFVFRFKNDDNAGKKTAAQNGSTHYARVNSENAD